MNDHSKEEYENNLKARLDILRTKLNDIILDTVDGRIRSMALMISHKEIPSIYKEISAESAAIKKSPVGLLFKANNKN